MHEKRREEKYKVIRRERDERNAMFANEPHAVPL